MNTEQTEQMECKSRMEIMQDRMDDVLNKVINGTMDLPTAKVVNSLFQTFINSANAETAFMQRTSQTLASNALTPKRLASDASGTSQQIEATKHGSKSTVVENGITTLVHRMAG